MLFESGYHALGVDPKAPEGASFRRVEFERCELPSRADAVVACTSLHHVAEPDEVLDKVAASLRPRGVVIVVEWDWENLDEATARWGFDRLGPADPGGWLARRREGWIASRQPWMSYLHAWATDEGLHGGERLIRELDRRFRPLFRGSGPYLFADLPSTSEADEAHAIEAGEIRATRIDYVGRARAD
jgi:SAM-dependent methyltransferase